MTKNFEQWSGAFSEMDIQVRDVVESGNNVAILFEAKGRHTGEIELAPGETVPATNKVVKMDVAEFLTIDRNGKIARDHTIFDMAGMMTQLGLLPSPQGATQPGQSRSARSR